MKLSNKEFDKIVQRAIRRIPDEIRQHLDNILITVQQWPDPDLLEEMGYPPDEPLLGVYWGVPLNERSATEPPLYPDTIYIFKGPLEEMCVSSMALGNHGACQPCAPLLKEEREAPGMASREVTRID